MKLLKKLADVLNGIDLSGFEAGTAITVTEAVADMLVKEGWAQDIPESAPLTPAVVPTLAT